MDSNQTTRRPAYKNIAHAGLFVEVGNIQVAFDDGTLTVDQYQGCAFIAHNVAPASCKVVISPNRVALESKYNPRPGDIISSRTGFEGHVYIDVQDDNQARLVGDYLAKHGFTVG